LIRRRPRTTALPRDSDVLCPVSTIRHQWPPRLSATRRVWTVCTRRNRVSSPYRSAIGSVLTPDLYHCTTYQWKRAYNCLRARGTWFDKVASCFPTTSPSTDNNNDSRPPTYIILQIFSFRRFSRRSLDLTAEECLPKSR